MDGLQPAQVTVERGVRKRLYRFISVGEDLGHRPVAAELGVLLFLVFIFVGACAFAVSVLALGPEPLGEAAMGVPIAFAAVAQISFGAFALRSRAFARARQHSLRRDCGLFLCGVGSLLVVLPVLMSAAAFVETIRSQLGLPPTPEVAHATLVRLQETGFGIQSLLVLLSAGLLVPIAEEIGWRGMLFPSLRQFRFSCIAANVITTTLFTAVHLPSITPGAMMQSILLLSILSLTLGWLRARTGSLAAPIGLHAAFNAFNLASVGFP